MDSMFNILLGIPLFHGISYQKLSEILGKYPFNFLKYDDGQTIIKAGEPCTRLATIVSGAARTRISSAENRVTVSQTICAPATIAPEFFFGKNTFYPSSVTAIGETGLMTIEKKDYIDIIHSDNVFLFNFLNIISVNAQQASAGVLALTSGDLRKRIAYWIVALTSSRGKDITMECRQRDLYAVFGVPRQSLVAALDKMKSDGILDYSASCIEISSRRKLVDMLDAIPFSQQ